MPTVPIKNFLMGEGEPLVLICGPCVIESEEHALFAAKTLKEIASSFSLPLIYKSSFDKANRLSINSFRGPGLEKGLRILEKVKKELKSKKDSVKKKELLIKIDHRLRSLT